MSSTKQRVYDLGNGVTISDDGNYLHANVVKDNKTSSSIGIRRPLLEMPEEVDILYSLKGELYYLPQFAEIHSFWLSVDTFSDLDGLQKNPLGGFGRKDHAFFAYGVNEYFRILMSFSFWSIKSGQTTVVPFDCDLARDYVSLIQEELKRQEKTFNEVVSPCGKTLSWFMKQVGEWEPLPEDPPPIKLY